MSLSRIMALLRAPDRPDNSVIASIASGSSKLTLRAQVAMLAQTQLAAREEFDDLVVRAVIRALVGIIGVFASLAVIVEVISALGAVR